MAKYNKRITIKFTYDASEYSLVIDITKNLIPRIDDFYTEDTALSGKKYKNYITTTEKKIWDVRYDFFTSDVYDFFKDASDAEKSGSDIVFSIEQDDGTFEDYDVMLNSFRAFDRTVTVFDRQKIYRDLSLEIKEI